MTDTSTSYRSFHLVIPYHSARAKGKASKINLGTHKEVMERLLTNKSEINPRDKV